VNRTYILWVLVLFFGSSLVFAGIRRLTDGEPAGVTFAAQAGALALMVAALVLFVRRRR
jgi:MYXO-CTERM domain-containing protein